MQTFFFLLSALIPLRDFNRHHFIAGRINPRKDARNSGFLESRRRRASYWTESFSTHTTMNTSSSPKRSRNSSPSPLFHAFPFHEALKGHAGLFQHIFFDLLDAETRHVCRGVASTWKANLSSLPAGRSTNTRLRSWAGHNGYVNLMALGKAPRRMICYPYVKSAVKRGDTDFVRLAAAIEKENAHLWADPEEDLFTNSHEEFKFKAAENADVPMLTLLHEISPDSPRTLFEYIYENGSTLELKEWADQFMADMDPEDPPLY